MARKKEKTKAFPSSSRVERPAEVSDRGLNDGLEDSAAQITKLTGLTGVLWFSLLTLYCSTTYPSVPGGDSGELLSAACEHGVSHPPGYPLWTMLSVLAINILPYSPAYNVNLLTCITAATSSALLFLVSYRLTGSITSSLISTVIFSLSPLTWTWSITGEVFALNNLFTTLLLLLLIDFEFAKTQQERKKKIYFGALISGLALTNQHTIVLYLPVIVGYVGYKVIKLKELSFSMAVSIITLGCVGLSPYCYLVLSSYKNTARWSWGDQSTLSGFITHLFREEYGTFKLGSNDGDAHGFLTNLFEYQRSLLHEFTWAGYCLAILGVLQIFMERNVSRRRLALMSLAMMLCYVCFFCWRANLDVSSLLMREIVERFWLQPNIIWSLLMAMGCKMISKQLRLVIPAPAPLMVIIFSAVLASCVGRGWHHSNHHSDTVVSDFANSMLSSLPNNSLVLTKGDLPSGTLRYIQFCEGKRADLTLIEQELMSYGWYIPKMEHLLPSVKFPGDRWYNVVGRTVDGLTTFNMLNFLDANINKRSIFVCIGMQEKESSWSTKYQLLPYGACMQVVRNSQHWAEYTSPYHDTWTGNYVKIRKGSWEEVANEEMWNAKISKLLYLYNAASQTTDPVLRSRLFAESYEGYSHILKTHVSVPTYYHKNYALACEKMARAANTPPFQVKAYLEESLKHFQIYIQTTDDDPQVSAIHQVIESLQTQIHQMK